MLKLRYASCDGWFYSKIVEWNFKKQHLVVLLTTDQLSVAPLIPSFIQLQRKILFQDTVVILAKFLKKIQVKYNLYLMTFIDCTSLVNQEGPPQENKTHHRRKIRPGSKKSRFSPPQNKLSMINDKLL